MNIDSIEMKELEWENQDIADAMDVADRELGQVDSMHEVVAGQPAMSHDAARVTEIAMEGIRRRLGIETPKVSISQEAVSDRQRFAVEGFKDTVKKVWEAIKRVMILLWDNLMSFVDNLLTLTGPLKKKAIDLKAKTRGFPSKAEPTQKFIEHGTEVARISRAFADANGRVNGPSLRSILDNHIKMAEGSYYVEKGITESFKLLKQVSKELKEPDKDLTGIVVRVTKSVNNINNSLFDFLDDPSSKDRSRVIKYFDEEGEVSGYTITVVKTSGVLVDQTEAFTAFITGSKELTRNVLENVTPDHRLDVDDYIGYIKIATIPASSQATLDDLEVASPKQITELVDKAAVLIQSVESLKNSKALMKTFIKNIRTITDEVIKNYGKYDGEEFRAIATYSAEIIRKSMDTQKHVATAMFSEIPKLHLKAARSALAYAEISMDYYDTE